LSGATITSCVINLANTTLGSGMLALPAAIASVGVFLGSFLLCLAAVGSGLGLYLLSRCAAYTSPYSKDASFFACARATYPKAALYINAAIAVKCFGVGVSYLIIVGDLIPEILAGLGYQVQGLLADRRLWITVSMAVVVPLSFLRTLNALRYTSVAALSAVVYLVMLVVWSFLDTSRPKPSDVEWGIVNGGKGVFYNLPIFVFAFTCHQNVCPCACFAYV
jgi:amino acid permease